MADRNRYDDRDRNRYDNEEDRGFFDEVRDWFRGDDEERDRNRDWDRNRDLDRDRQQYQRRDRDWDRDRWQDWGQNRQSGWNRDYNREQDWDRSQQRSWGVNRNQESDRNRWQDRNQNRREWDQDWNRDRQGGWGEGGMNRQGSWNRSQERDWGEDWDRGRQDWGRNRQRDWQRDNDQDFGRTTYGDRYGWNYDRGWDGEQSFGQDYDRGYGRRDYGQQGGRQMRDRWQQQGRGQSGRGQYGTAGMRSDYGTNYDYEDDYNRSQWRGGRGQNRDFDMRDRDYDRGYVGYDREGAFYQDLDEPYTYEYWEFWMVPGEFSGVGPESYHRSDERLHEEVCERLTRHGRIDARNIEIEVKEGEIVLRGDVASREMKRMAEDVAESVSGQKEVRNEIKVRKEERHTGSEMRTGQTTGMQAGTMGMGTQTGHMGTQRTGQTGTGGGNAKRNQLRQGMEVIGKNGKIVGRVKEVRDNDFLVDRDMARDVYVPFDAVDSIGAQAMLEVTADEVDNQDWETPDLL
jgi:hypothetical protein